MSATRICGKTLLQDAYTARTDPSGRFYFMVSCAQTTTEAHMPEQINVKGIMEGERTRLTTRKTELETELAQIEEELDAVNRYFGVTAKPDFKLTPPKPPDDRPERGAVQEQVKATIYSRPEGISTGELNRALPDVSGQSIQNALGSLRKSNQIVKDGARGGKYRPITLEPTPPTDADAPQ